MFVGGDVEVAEYKTTGTDELARRGGEARRRRRPRCSWPTTGCSRSGKNPKDVLHIAALVERTAEIIWGARQLGDGRAAPRRGEQAVPGLLPLRPHREVLSAQAD